MWIFVDKISITCMWFQRILWPVKVKICYPVSLHALDIIYKPWMFIGWTIVLIAYVWLQKCEQKVVIIGSSWYIIRASGLFFSHWATSFLGGSCHLSVSYRSQLFDQCFPHNTLPVPACMYPSCSLYLFVVFLQGKKVDGSVNAYAINVSQKRKYRYENNLHYYVRTNDRNYALGKEYVIG